VEEQVAARLLERAPCGFLSFDDDGNLLYVNGTLADMLGAPAESLLHQRIDTILTVPSRIFYQTHFFPLLKLHGEAEEIYITFRAVSGESVHALVNAVRRTDDDGAPRTDCVILRIKERQKYEAELIRARKAAEEANRSKSRFLTMMSHDLRTPLNAVVGYAELLLLGVRGQLNEDQAAYLRRMQAASRFLLTLLNDVLDLARAEAKELPLALGPTRLDTVLAEVESMMAPRLNELGLEYTRTCDTGRRVQADPDRLKQITLNLLSNAAKFTKSPGRVWVECVDDGPAVAIRVRDTGRGIPADSLGRIFEPFVQVDKRADAKNQKGVGLGLAISRELARAMGGDLSVESEIDKGSTFTISLPGAEPAPAVPRPG
jgi:PAS domain S-box-containing protein